jgi:micrococcal nuclease
MHILLLWLSYILTLTQPFTAKVIGVKDGDTIEVFYQNTKQTIRLEHIDCPEKKQPFGKQAKQYVSTLCYGKMVTINHTGKKDRNKRLIAEVYINKICINKQLLQEGLAWHFKKYSTRTDYAALEVTAKQQKKGLWKDANAIAPWLWRKAKKH